MRKNTQLPLSTKFKKLKGVSEYLHLSVDCNCLKDTEACQNFEITKLTLMTHIGRAQSTFTPEPI